jgi:hypothetical protein
VGRSGPAAWTSPQKWVRFAPASAGRVVSWSELAHRDGFVWKFGTLWREGVGGEAGRQVGSIRAGVRLCKDG